MHQSVHVILVHNASMQNVVFFDFVYQVGLLVYLTFEGSRYN